VGFLHFSGRGGPLMSGAYKPSKKETACRGTLMGLHRVRRIERGRKSKDKDQC